MLLAVWRLRGVLVRIETPDLGASYCAFSKLVRDTTLAVPIIDQSNCLSRNVIHLVVRATCGDCATYIALIGGVMQRGALILAILALSACGDLCVHAQFISTADQLGYQLDLPNETRFVPLATLSTPMIAMGGHNGEIIYGISDTSELLNLSRIE